MSEFDKYLTAIGKSRDTATDLDEIQWLRSERQRLRLTDEEREAVACGIQAIGLAPYDEKTLAYADRLRGLLERTQ
jgi:hypothetical protein